MASYIVTYDLNREINRPPIVKAIDELSDGWARLSESSYAITTASTPQQVYNILKKHLDSNDQLYVIHLNRPHSGQGSKEVNDWLANNLDRESAR